MVKIFVSFLIFSYGSIVTGYLTKRILPDMENLSKPIANAVLSFLIPIIILNSFWSLDLGEEKLFLLPFINICVLSLTIIPAILISKGLKLTRRETGSFVSTSMFSNVGITLGGFICYLLFGDRGLFLSALYNAFFVPYFYIIGFLIMRIIKSDISNPGIKKAVVDLFRNPTSAISIITMIIGVILNIFQLQRPALLNTIATKYITYLSVCLNSFAIGLGLNIRKSFNYIKHGFLVSLIKFLYNPAVTYVLISISGLSKLEDNVPARVVFVLSFMPSAILSVTLSKIFDMNDDLANIAWLLSNMSIIIILPGLAYLMKLI